MWFDGENELVNVEFINNCSDFVIISFMSLIHLFTELTYFILISLFYFYTFTCEFVFKLHYGMHALMLLEQLPVRPIHTLCTDCEM
jgi:uncharacterized membrane protein